MSKKSALSSLGRSIIKDRFKKYSGQDASWLHTTDLEDSSDYGKMNLRSITEESSLEEFLHNAQLANRQFTAEKMNIQLISNGPGLPSKEEEVRLKEVHEKFRDRLKIPRRPEWDESTTPEELNLRERDAFLNWRRLLSHLAENDGLILTPFERNLDVWRQLWRVIEKSDVVIQIVDARNPLFFRCEDLEQYVKEINKDKQNILLLNKADFLSFEQREMWTDYFDKQGITAVFWSAAAELSRLKEATENMNGEPIKEHVSTTEHGKNSSKVLNVDELTELLNTFPLKCSNATGIRTFGLVGYPNVGKSSTINALLTRKEQLAAESNEKTKHLQAPVSATPGKTKHFQTFFLDKSLMICDCPGLVMPSFVSTKAEMITSGVLPIDRMTDCISPTSIVCKHIPREVLEATYGIMLPTPTDEICPNRYPTPDELLSAYARIRGFMKHKGLPDIQRASRFVLKDYVNGKLCYCYSPPDISEEVYGSKPKVNAETAKVKTIDTKEVFSNGIEQLDPCLWQLEPSAGTRGNSRPAVPGSEPSAANNGRPSKRHGNAHKREKLRRTFVHLDA